MARFIFITGGVVSSLGKGLMAASLAALLQARRPHEAGTHLQRSLELAVRVDADYEVALTLQALARARLRGPKAEEESRAILDRLGVLSTPLVPLP